MINSVWINLAKFRFHFTKEKEENVALANQRKGMGKFTRIMGKVFSSTSALIKMLKINELIFQ